MDVISKNSLNVVKYDFFLSVRWNDDEGSQLMAKMWKLNYLIKLTIKRNGFVLLSTEMEVNIHKFITFFK